MNVLSLVKLKNNNFNTVKDIYNKLRQSKSEIKNDCYKTIGQFRSRYEYESKINEEVNNNSDSDNFGLCAPAVTMTIPGFIKQTKGYYDDIAFIHNGIPYMVYYYHPRYEFSDIVDDESWELLIKKYSVKEIAKNKYKIWIEEKAKMWDNPSNEQMLKIENKIVFYLGDKFIYIKLILNKEVVYVEDQIELVDELRKAISNNAIAELLNRYPNYSKEELLGDKKTFLI